MTRLDEVTGSIRTIGVVGLGTMGAGIVQAALQSGYPVIAWDASEIAVRRGRDRIDGGLKKFESKGKIEPGQAEVMMGRLKMAEDVSAFAEADLVVEAVLEQEGIKTELFGSLDEACPDSTILATNTSSISITRLAASTKRPDRFIGMHFMNPVPLMKLVEVIRGLETSDETFDVVRSTAAAMGKSPVEVNDSPGFVSNRVLLPMINEAIFALHEGVGTPEAIDEVMKLGMNHPLGPLALADMIGLDVCLDIMRVLNDGFADSKYRPCPLLIKMVDSGRLGRKSGRGFYDYGD
ncbi:MAG: 3-hydroxybutyryl-CoA dehydrogenase [Acidobacteriota bacterium]